MQGHHDSAGRHIRSGVKLLLEAVDNQRNGTYQYQKLGNKSVADSYVPLEVLTRVFANLGDQQARQTARDYSFIDYGQKLALGLSGAVPLSISSIEEAKTLFDYGQCLLGSNLNELVPGDLSEDSIALEAHINYCASLMTAFLDALHNFEACHRTLFNRRDEMSLAVLKLHVLNAQVSYHLEQLPPSYQPNWFEFLPQMQQMVALAERIVCGTSSSYHLQGGTTSFCLDMGFIIPLWTVARHCRDPLLRRRSIELLRSTSRQEGLWNSLLVAQAAERVMEIQEDDAEEVKDYTDGDHRCFLPNSPPVLVLDSKGGRLEYIRYLTQDSLPTNVIEEVWSW
ncbi:hypothetical protein TruAng_004496 [Truncatella angustata]|nr:hypothetical protein TruAng_004496 [Truncatella angustata]